MKTKFFIISLGGIDTEFRKLIEKTFEGWWDLTNADKEINAYLVSSKKYTTVREIIEKFNGYKCAGCLITKIRTTDDFYNIGDYGGEKNTNWLKSFATDDIQELLYDNENGAIPNIVIKKKNP